MTKASSDASLVVAVDNNRNLIYASYQLALSVFKSNF